MRVMCQEERLLFLFLREALYQGHEEFPVSLTVEEASKLFEIAEKQAVSGLVIEALTRNNVGLPKDKVFEAVGLQEQIKARSWHVNQGIIALNKVLSAEHINYAIVKGQIVASYYPSPLLRQSGDIDFYLSPYIYIAGMNAINTLWGVDAEIHGSEKHADFQYDGNVYEAHFILTDLLSHERNKYFQEVLDRDEGTTVTIDGHEIRTLSLTLHVLYVFLHLWYHLMALGVGLRQFCDLAMMLHNAKNQIDMNALCVHLKVLEMERAWKACCSILIDNLGLSHEKTGYIITDDDRRYGNKIIDIVLYRGNMGHYNKIGGFCGWKHKTEAMCIKLAHFVKFYSLSPSYSRQWLWHEVMRRNKA